jgi:hypothetical protein
LSSVSLARFLRLSRRYSRRFIERSYCIPFTKSKKSASVSRISCVNFFPSSFFGLKTAPPVLSIVDFRLSCPEEVGETAGSVSDLAFIACCEVDRRNRGFLSAWIVILGRFSSLL